VPTIMDTAALTPVLQFGTSRFLQAHVDLFLSEALAAGRGLGRITVVQTTDSAASALKTAALASGQPYPVIIQGRQQGVEIQRTLWSNSIAGAVHAHSAWPALRRGFVTDVQVVLSNTGDNGYCLDDRDGPEALAANAAAPHGFPAKLLVLLHDRWQENSAAPLSLFPCELVSRNGDVLREVVAGLATHWGLEPAFGDYLASHCKWANSIVDRIVSEALEPIGAIAEPYALWAIEAQPGLQLPCEHPAIVVTDSLQGYERLKLLILNLSHTYLAERWQRAQDNPGLTVYQALNRPYYRDDLEGLWATEVLPVFAALGEEASARRYLDEVRDRLLNPFLQHRLADIGQNHAEKKRRRLLPLVELAASHAPSLPLPRLSAALAVAGDPL